MQYRRLKAIEKVAKVIKAHYEPQNHAKCYKQIWRNFIRPEMGLSYPTFVRYIKEIKHNKEIDTIKA